MSDTTPENRSLMQQFRALLLLLALTLLLAPLLIYKTIGLTRSAVLDEIRQSSAHTLNLVVENLHGELARFQALPHLLASDPIYRKLWDPLKTRNDERRINLLLEKNKNITGALDLYIMDPNGLTIAASNWQSNRTFIGRNFSFRPYFQQAMQGSLGRYFALGTTSGERGYYFSYPIRKEGRILGVMVCKIKVGDYETAWNTGQNEIIVTDKDGIVFLSSNTDWLFHSLTPLSLQDLKRVRGDRQYGNAQLASLDLKRRKIIDKNTALVTVKTKNRPNRASSARPAALRQLNKKQQYLQLRRDMNNAGWQVHILAKTTTIQTQIWRNSFAVTVLLFSILIGGALLLERFRRNQERIDMQKKSQVDLERRVLERTRELQQAQRELIQAGKLAALGKMSAGLSHELNQPLAAIRSYSDNAGTFLQRGLVDPARKNLNNIGELTERMARIIKHLRTYASKDKIEAGPTDLVVAVREAVKILAYRIDKENVTIIDQLPQNAILAHGGAVRLQQVFINILSNAFDAVNKTDKKQITISLDEGADMFTIAICDSGPGLSPTELDRVFDPFFSTKEVGEGVGLGLSISYGIISQFGGRIEAENCQQGGAALKVTLLKEPLETPASGTKLLEKDIPRHV